MHWHRRGRQILRPEKGHCRRNIGAENLLLAIQHFGHTWVVGLAASSEFELLRSLLSRFCHTEQQPDLFFPAFRL
jgi:hypothetical protein